MRRKGPESRVRAAGGGRARREAAEAAPSRHPLGMRQGEAWPRRKHRARKLPHVWERSSRAARTPARAKRRPRQNDVLENRLFRAPLQLLRATAKRTAAAREAAATRGDNRQPCSSGTLQPRVKRGGAHGRGRQCREALRLLMPRCFGRGGCAAAIAGDCAADWLSIVAPLVDGGRQMQAISSAQKRSIRTSRVL